MNLRSTSLVVVAALASCAQTKPDGASRLSASPRHQEWLDATHDGRAVRCFVVFPESAKPATAVVVIHENKGLTDWVRSVADRLAEEGYVAIAPDLLSGAGPGGGGTDAFASEDAATKALYALPAAQVTADLDAVAQRAKSLPGASGTLACVGFCWGGGQSFRFATTRADLAAAFVFYGTAPEEASAFASIRCPVHGFYAGDDARVHATLAKTEERMSAAGKTSDPVVYPGAGHAFMRLGEASDAKPANKAAREDSWTRLLDELRRL